MKRRILRTSAKKYLFFFPKNADVSNFVEIQGLLSRGPLIFLPETDCIYSYLYLSKNEQKINVGSKKKIQDFCPQNIESTLRLHGA